MEENIGAWFNKNNWKDMRLVMNENDRPLEGFVKAEPLDGVEYQHFDEGAGKWMADPNDEEIVLKKEEEKLLLAELAEKDYKVIKAAEAGLVLAEQDPALHARRDRCRTRINEIRDRLAELGA